jgi:hypothetical protein
MSLINYNVCASFKPGSSGRPIAVNSIPLRKLRVTSGTVKREVKLGSSYFFATGSHNNLLEVLAILSVHHVWTQNGIMKNVAGL